MSASCAFKPRTFDRIRALLLSTLVCFGRHTITSMLSTAGCQFRDWTADYRLFSKGRFRAEPLFEVARQAVVEQLAKGAPLVVAMDDTLLRKSGKRTAGVSYRRDPLGPRFQKNFVLAQRVLQVSAALPSKGSTGPARMIPIDFRHAPTPKKPSKHASDDELKAYRSRQKAQAISQLGVSRLTALRERMDSDPSSKGRELWAVVDGSYINRTVLRQLPDRTVLIGRIRADAKLSYLPSSKGQGPGRRRIYGETAPTPQQLQYDESVPWQTAPVHAAGKVHELRYKRLDSLRWRAAGELHLLSVIVIAPLGYRGLGSRLKYRKPAFLICTNTDLPTERILQAYAWRWEIEVNFRDEKTLLGVGQAQVRNDRSVEAVPAMIVAAYSLLHVAASKYYANSEGAADLPAPKWRRDKPRERFSTMELVNLLRADLWAAMLDHPNFWHFAKTGAMASSVPKSRPRIESAVLYACA